MSTSHRVTFAALLLAGVLCAVIALVGRGTDGDPLEPEPGAPVAAAEDDVAVLASAGEPAVGEASVDAREVAPSTRSERAPVRAETRAPRAQPDPPAKMLAPMTVRVVDARDVAIPGARVRAELCRENGLRLRVTRADTDAAGIARIDAAGAASVKLFVTPAAETLAHAELEVERDVAPELVVRLQTRRWLVLTIVDGAGAPVPDVEWVELAGERVRAAPPDRRCDGPSGVHRIEVGGAPGVAHVRSTRAGVGEHAYDPEQPSTMQGTVRLARGSVIEAVVTRDARPAEGVRVALVERRDPVCLTVGHFVLGYRTSFPERLHGEQTSDANGRVTFAIHEFRAYVLVAEAQGVGACEREVLVDQVGRRVDVQLELSRGNAVELRVVDAGAARVPITLFGPAGTRRGAVLDAGGTYVADGLPPGAYVAIARSDAPDSGRHFMLGGNTRTAVELTTIPRCRLAVAGPDELELYAVMCPTRRIPKTERNFSGAVGFETDDLGPHALVWRRGRGTVVVRPVLLHLGEQSLRLDPPERDATFEVVASKSFDARRHWWRTVASDGLQTFQVLGSDVLIDPSSGERVKGHGWSARVPAGAGELVRIADDGSLEVVVASVRIGSGESHRVVLESER